MPLNFSNILFRIQYCLQRSSASPGVSEGSYMESQQGPLFSLPMAWHCHGVSGRGVSAFWSWACLQDQGQTASAKHSRKEENTCHKQGSPREMVLSLRIVPAPSSRKGHLAFSRSHFNANVFSQTEEAKQMWAIWQGCSSFVSKCERLVGRILNITLVIHKHFIFQEKQRGEGCIR